MPLTEAQIAWLSDKLGMDPASLRGTGPAARGAERTAGVLDEFVERQTMYGQQQQDIPDGPPDPDLNEPDRIPELDQGPEPVERLVRMRDIKYTQENVSPRMGDGRPIDDISARMQQDGWDPASPDPDMVQNADGRSATTLDHRRLVAAEHAGIDEVPAQMHSPDEPLPEEMEGRFKLQKNFTDPETGTTYRKGDVAETWGEAARFRAANQGGEFPAGGDARQPWLKPDQPAPAAEPEPPTLSERADAAMRDFMQENPAAKDVVNEFDAAEAARNADLEPTPSEPAATPRSAPTPRPATPPAPESVLAEPVLAEPVLTPPSTPPSTPASTPISETAPAVAADAEAAAGGAEAGMGSAVKGGLLGAGIAAGIQVAQDWDKVQSGQMSVGDAAIDAGGKAAEVGGLTFAGVAVADAVVGGAGAEAGALAAAGSTMASVASKGGVIGGIVAGGIALVDDIGRVQDGTMTGGTATVDVGVKTAIGVGAGMAGAAAGAEIGALVGSVVPGAGTAIGFVAGAVVGGAVGYIGNALTNTETGQEIVHAAGAAVDTAIDGVESAAGAVADAASTAASAVEDAASSVADAAGGLFDSIVGAVTD